MISIIKQQFGLQIIINQQNNFWFGVYSRLNGVVSNIWPKLALAQRCWAYYIEYITNEKNKNNCIISFLRYMHATFYYYY